MHRRERPRPLARLFERPCRDEPRGLVLLEGRSRPRVSVCARCPGGLGSADALLAHRAFLGEHLQDALASNVLGITSEARPYAWTIGECASPQMVAGCISASLQNPRACAEMSRRSRTIVCVVSPGSAPSVREPLSEPRLGARSRAGCVSAQLGRARRAHLPHAAAPRGGALRRGVCSCSMAGAALLEGQGPRELARGPPESPQLPGPWPLRLRRTQRGCAYRRSGLPPAVRGRRGV
mmetsp:Transcript_172838/g.554113  ORF Transcript_172838/g.554113 Transcript_172838/m.554113 type:complete len:237 (-) Transcript_172838:595-1305(-)